MLAEFGTRYDKTARERLKGKSRVHHWTVLYKSGIVADTRTEQKRGEERQEEQGGKRPAFQ